MHMRQLVTLSRKSSSWGQLSHVGAESYRLTTIRGGISYDLDLRRHKNFGKKIHLVSTTYQFCNKKWKILVDKMKNKVLYIK